MVPYAVCKGQNCTNSKHETLGSYHIFYSKLILQISLLLQSSLITTTISMVALFGDFPRLQCTTILSDWLVTGNLARLDSAMCNTKYRENFLSTVTGQTVSFSEDKPHTSLLAMKRYDWLILRSVKLKDVTLLGGVGADLNDFCSFLLPKLNMTRLRRMTIGSMDLNASIGYRSLDSYGLGPTINVSVITAMSKAAPNVQYLELNNYNECIHSVRFLNGVDIQFAKLVAIKVINESITTDILHKIVGGCTALKSVEFTGVIFDHVALILQTIVKNNPEFSKLVMVAGGTTNRVLPICNSLRHIEVTIDCYTTVDKHLLRHCTSCVLLEYLEINRGVTLVDVQLEDVNCSMLATLKLIRCDDLTDQTVDCLTARCAVLRRVKLDCELISPKSVSMLIQSASADLEEINVKRGCSGINRSRFGPRDLRNRQLAAETAVTIEHAKPVPVVKNKLKVLKASGFVMTSAVAGSIARYAPNVQRFSFYESIPTAEQDDLAADGDVEAIRMELCELATNCHQLKVLALYGNRYLSDAFLAKLSANCPQLNTLKMEYCNGPTGSGFLKLLRGCPHMKTLRFHYLSGSKPPTAAVKAIKSEFPKLSLYVDKWKIGSV